MKFQRTKNNWNCTFNLFNSITSPRSINRDSNSMYLFFSQTWLKIRDLPFVMVSKDSVMSTCCSNYLLSIVGKKWYWNVSSNFDCIILIEFQHQRQIDHWERFKTWHTKYFNTISHNSLCYQKALEISSQMFSL